MVNQKPLCSSTDFKAIDLMEFRSEFSFLDKKPNTLRSQIMPFLLNFCTLCQLIPVAGDLHNHNQLFISSKMLVVKR
jgi:hypothetical protein